MPTDCSSYKIPILLGVTGHRNVVKSQYPRIRELLTAFIEEQVFRKYPDSPVRLLTPLADGADRLVAEIALQCGIPIVVPLPMEKESYLATFVGEAGSPERADSIAEFERLLAKAESSFVLPKVTCAPEGGVLQPETERDNQFALVGAYMAKHCHILIALYDGRHSDAMGGTSQIVNYRKNGVMKGLPLKISSDLVEERFDFLCPDSIFDLQNTGIIWRVTVDRENSPQINPEVRITQESTEETTERATEETADTSPQDTPELARFAEALRKIDCFNRDVGEYQAWIDPKCELYSNGSADLHRSKQSLLDADARNHGNLNQTRSVFVAADQLSIMFSDDHKNYFTVFCTIVAGITVAELLYAHDLQPVAAMGAYFFFLLVGLGAYGAHKKRSVHSKYNEYRALAEALRVQFFWRCAGLRAIVPDHYLRKHQNETLWISAAIKSLAINNFGSSPNDVSFVFHAWIKDQSKYYADRLERLHGTEQFHEILIWSLYALMFVLSGVGVLLHEAVSHAVMSLSLGLIPVTFAILDHKANFNAEFEKIRSYKIYSKLFNTALKKLAVDASDDCHDENMSRKIIYQLGCEALIENGDWLIVNRDKKAEAAK